MKVCIAQTRPIKGDIEKNIISHKSVVDVAAANGADIIVFPELSITSYEPQLAEQLATGQEDKRFEDFQTISNTKNITIVFGVPIKVNSGICISLLIFQPGTERRIYSKKYLHHDEEAFFVSGENFPCLKVNNTNVSLAICYELSIPEHSENAFKNGAQIYIASVAKSLAGVEKAQKSLSDIANKYSMPVLMANAIGRCDDFESAGKSSVWNNEGELIAQLNELEEGILIFDTEIKKVFSYPLNN